MAIPRRQKEITGRHSLVDGIRYVMPIDSWDASAIVAVFPCDFQQARKLILHGYVQPFRIWNSALLIVTVIDYRKTDIGSYIEYSIAIACTYGKNPAMRLLPGLFRNSFGTGQYVVDLPVSARGCPDGAAGSQDWSVSKLWEWVFLPNTGGGGGGP